MAWKLAMKFVVDFVEESVKGTIKYGPPIDPKAAYDNVIKLYSRIFDRNPSDNPIAPTSTLDGSTRELESAPVAPPPQAQIQRSRAAIIVALFTMIGGMYLAWKAVVCTYYLIQEPAEAPASDDPTEEPVGLGILLPPRPRVGLAGVIDLD